jgi:hypothetical protein
LLSFLSNLTQQECITYLSFSKAKNKNTTQEEGEEKGCGKKG